MGKRVSIFIALAGILGLVFCGISQGSTGTVNVESEAGVTVYGPVTDTDFNGNATGTAGAAVEFTPDASWPQAPNPPNITGDSKLTGAKWITSTASSPDSTKPNYTLFQDSYNFTPPCTASDLIGSVNAAANNNVTVYVNEASVGTTPDSGSGAPVLQAFPFDPVSGENSFSFDVTTNEPSNTNPIGVIYNAVISFSLPDVVWRPPIVGTGRNILKNGTTLPIKFVLKNNGVRLNTQQEIYLSISNTQGEVARFTLGQGLMFSPGNGQYHAQFHTRNYNLQSGTQYTVSVNDSCSNTTLGSITIQISGKNKHGMK